MFNVRVKLACHALMLGFVFRLKKARQKARRKVLELELTVYNTLISILL